MVFLLCAPQKDNTRLQDGRLELQASGSSKETVPPFSRAIGQAINCFSAAVPKHHETLLGLHQAAFGRIVAVFA